MIQEVGRPSAFDRQVAKTGTVQQAVRMLESWHLSASGILLRLAEKRSAHIQSGACDGSFLALSEGERCRWKRYPVAPFLSRSGRAKMEEAC